MATHSSIPVWKIPLQRSLAGYSPGGRKESVTIEHARAHECTKIHRIVYFKMVSFMLCEFYLNLKIAKKKRRRKRKKSKFFSNYNQNTSGDGTGPSKWQSDADMDCSIPSQQVSSSVQVGRRAAESPWH